jgi:orotidine-5'-phosphate decarboxylase
MERKELIQQIKAKQSFLCVGLDPDLKKIPKHLLTAEDPIFEFNREIIDATADFCVAYKPNTAFYEAYGLRGWSSLIKTIEYLNKNYPHHFTIADAKRGDIGNTSEKYAQAFFSEMNFDSITVAPYMGSDSVLPFLTFKDKWVILLALTSNDGAFDFQTKEIDGGTSLFEQVIHSAKTWGNPDNMMFVVGATKAEMLGKIRQIIPDHFLLVPGVGAQGGSLAEVCKYGMNKDVGLLVNSSRNIIYAGNDSNFGMKARAEAMKIADAMSQFIR